MTTDTIFSPIPMDDSFLLGGDTRIRRIGLGTMRLTDSTGDGTPTGAQIWRSAADPSAATKLLRRAVDLGVQLIDTADAYALGDSEALISQALFPYPKDLVIATKVGNVRPSPTEWVPLGHPGYLKQQVELSLRRLRVEKIDLLQLHRLDPDFPIADQVGALRELKEQGKIQHIGLSEVNIEQLAEAEKTTPIAAVQNLYNLSNRHHEGVIDYALERGIAFLPFFPLAVGHLARPGSLLDAVAGELAVDASQVTLAWLLHRAANVMPIPGTTSLSHLAANVLAGRVVLTAQQFQRIAAMLDSRPSDFPGARER